jgi:hypothetical protein
MLSKSEQMPVQEQYLHHSSGGPPRRFGQASSQINTPRQDQVRLRLGFYVPARAGQANNLSLGYC